MNYRDAYIVARFDYRNLVRSAPGVIFLVLYLYIAIMLGTYLADLLQVEKFIPPGAQASAAHARQAMDTMLAKIVAWFIKPHDEAVSFLVFDRPVAMSAFFLLSLLIMPVLVQFLAFNQISGYVNRRSVRYLVTKTGRLELYLGLFASNLFFFTVVSGALSAVMTVGWILASQQVGAAMVIGYSLRILAAIWLACVPVIAYMSLIAAMTGSPVATIFIGLGGYFLVNIFGSLISRQTEYGQIFFYVLPLEVKYWFAYPGAGRFLAAAGLMLVYTAGYLVLGWLLLRRRNL